MEGNGSMGEVRGGRGGGRQSVVEAARGNPFITFPLRTEKPFTDWDRDARHGSHKSRASRRLGDGEHDKQRLAAVRSQAESEGSPAKAPSASARAGEATEGRIQHEPPADHPKLSRHRQKPLDSQK